MNDLLDLLAAYPRTACYVAALVATICWVWACAPSRMW